MKSRWFVPLWVLAVAAATSAFCLHIGLRVRAIELGYELGRAQARVARLREVKRVLELERAAYRTPERVDLIARTLLGMAEPSPDRMLSAGDEPAGADDETALAPSGSASSASASGAAAPSSSGFAQIGDAP